MAGVEIRPSIVTFFAMSLFAASIETMDVFIIKAINLACGVVAAMALDAIVLGLVPSGAPLAVPPGAVMMLAGPFARLNIGQRQSGAIAKFASMRSFGLIMTADKIFHFVHISIGCSHQPDQFESL